MGGIGARAPRKPDRRAPACPLAAFRLHANGGTHHMALTSITGSLASTDLLNALGAHDGPTTALRASLKAARQLIGPASSARQVLDVQVLPLARAFGLDVTVTSTGAGSVLAAIHKGGRSLASLSVAGWGADLRRLRDHAAKHPAAAAPRWWFGANGKVIRSEERRVGKARRGRR